MNHRSLLRLGHVAAGVLLMAFLLSGRASEKSSAKGSFSFNRDGVSRHLNGWSAVGLQQANQSTAQTEKTVEQVQKNIKILSGLPESQLIPVMNLMGASLGVRCSYCHVNKDSKWDFVADEKPEKLTAREMIKMVLAINKTNFRGNTEVSCFTCHRGRTGPVGVPTLPLAELTETAGVQRLGPAATAAASPTVNNATATATPTPAAPSAEDILNKYISAVGGQTVIDRIKTRVMKGTSINPNGMTMNLEIYQAAPEKFYLSVSGPRESMERGFNGNIGWEKNRAGVHEIMGQQLADLKQTFQLFADLRLKEQFIRMSVGRDKIDNRDVFVIRAVRPDRRRDRLYFDAETGLLVRRIRYTDTPIGVIPEEVDFEDYRDVEGVKIPFTVRVSATDPFANATRKFTEVKLNAPVDESKFTKPTIAGVPGQ